mgnify:CR=1 FL=1
MANKKGTGLMLVGADIPADKEADFNQWYQEEHLQELMGVPGILNAARYEATKSGPKHLAVYELESVDVVNTDAFKNRPRTEWGQKVSPSLIGTNFFNLVLDMIHPCALTDDIAGSDMANALQIGRMDVPAANDDDWNEWYSGVYVPNYEKCPGVIRGRATGHSAGLATPMTPWEILAPALPVGWPPSSTFAWIITPRPTTGLCRPATEMFLATMV